MNTWNRYLCCAAALLLIGGCRTQRQITTYEELRNVRSDPIRALGTNGALYELIVSEVRDSVFRGKGEVIRDGMLYPFSGELRFADLVYLQAPRTDLFRGILACGVLGFTTAWAINAGKEDGLRIWRPSAGGGSCPYIYVWDGGTFSLQGEVFGTSFGRGLEGSTTCMLPAAVPAQGKVAVRVTNERPETHYVNQVRLLAYDAPAGATVLLDADNAAWPVIRPAPVIDGPREIMRRDSIWWTSGREGTRPGGDGRDAIECLIPHPRGAAQGSVILHVTNTRIFDAVYEVVFGFLGKDQLPFLYRLEHDQELIGVLRKWIQECSLTVEYWNDGAWQKAGLIIPEANVAEFSRIVRLQGCENLGENIRIRLTCLADTWKIDAVQVDWEPASALRPEMLPLVSARHSSGGSPGRQIGRMDEEYSLLLPGECLDLEFTALPGRAGRRTAYALEAGGYLYEWMPEAPEHSGIPAMLARLMPDRLALMPHLLRHREAFLPLVYARWEELRH